MTTQMNPYNIKWSIITVNSGKITKQLMTKLAKFGYARYSDNTAIRHSPNSEVANARQKEAIAVLKDADKDGSAIIITDKQFGLSTVTYNGISKQTALKNSKVIVDGKRVVTIPVTEDQIKAIVKF